MSQHPKAKVGKPPKIVKLKKQNRRSTLHTRNHRFESFNERISKLKIDPIRRKRAPERHEELSEESGTYFGRSLEEWKESNLSKNFAEFARHVTPYCDSLAMVVHHENEIMDFLAEYICLEDAVAMEPLLSLMSHFAHDLDVRFEKYFKRAVTIITRVAAKHQDPAVVEWSFTCLAWLFKYLSRLLAPDLRPLYTLMAPYLGKENQKTFVVRFAAESLSFLVRKAAASYERDPAALDKFIHHVLEDCVATRDLKTASLHHQGVMTLFTEAMKAPGGGLHSAAPSITLSLLSNISFLASKTFDEGPNILTGTLTSLIHHTNATSFSPILDVVVSTLDTHTDSTTELILSTNIVTTIVTVRKGTRIGNWTPVVSIVKSLVRHAHSLVLMDPRTSQAILSCLAVTIRYAKLDTLLTMSELLDTIARGNLSKSFLRFCDICSRLGEERFTAFVLQPMRRYINDHWHEQQDFISMLLARLAERGLTIRISLSPAQQQSLLERVTASERNIPLSSRHVALSALPYVEIGNTTRQNVLSTFLQKIREALDAPNTIPANEFDFVMGPCFAYILAHMEATEALGTLWDGLCQVSSRLAELVQFWDNIACFLGKCPYPSVQSQHESTLEHALIRNVSSPSSDLRQSSLEVLERLYTARGKPVPDVLQAALTVQSSPISLDTLRIISMNVRRLATGYDQAIGDDLLARIVPTFCFGLMHFRLSQIWDNATDVLAQIATVGVAEEIIVSLVQEWLEMGPQVSEETPQEPLVLHEGSEGIRVMSDFECSNLALVHGAFAQVFDSPFSGYLAPEAQVAHDLRRVEIFTTKSREQALKVLRKIPQMAEKRSRMLVPVLLRWAGDHVDGDGDDRVHRWSRKDQKSMLALFAKFSNPKVLFRSLEVYSALLNLCANGDLEIQQSSLRAILSWKEEGVSRYQEHLFNLLDEERFREELSVFLQTDGDDAIIRQEDYDTLMPILLRLLYGRAVAGGKHGPGARRQAIFVSLSQFGITVLEKFVDIALSKIQRIQYQLSGAELDLPLRQQLGTLNMLDDLIGTIGSDLSSCATPLMEATLRCTISASVQIEGSSDIATLPNASLLRSIRQGGIQCLVKLYDAFTESDMDNAAINIKTHLFFPRLEKFAIENTQSVSGLLRLISIWAKNARTALYLKDDRILHEVARLLREPSTKDEVRIFILQDVVGNLLAEPIDETILQPHVSDFVSSIGALLSQPTSRDILDTSIQCLTNFASRIADSDQACGIVDVCAKFLTKPSKSVSPLTKVNILKTLLALLEQFELSWNETLFTAVSGLYSRLQDPQSRVILSDVLMKLVRSNAGLDVAATICRELNSQSIRLDEPDYDTRAQGYQAIQKHADVLTSDQWLPIVHSCMFYILDAGDMVTRSSASQALLRFAQVAGDDGAKFGPLVEKALLPGIEYGLRNTSELVRAEYLQVLGCLVAGQYLWPTLHDLKPLTVGADDEASVFTNILHIQHHRRLRALRRLAEQAGELQSINVTRFFLPLLEHFVFDQAVGDAGRTLADQTVITIGSIVKSLNWSSYRAVFRRYSGYLSSKEELEKTVLRLLGVLVDAIPLKQEQDRLDGTKENVVCREFLPPLLKYLHQKDESTVDRRMPLAVTIVKLLLVLSDEELSARLPSVLTDIAHVLRSRSQEARDQARRTLNNVILLVGQAYFGFVVKELRSVLSRGYQLHVLSFTVHSLLVGIADSCEPGDLNHCLPDLTSVIMDDVFGTTGQEKDAEEYTSSMKEVKGQKSYDTMELLAKMTPIAKIGLLVEPLRALLAEKLDAKSLKKAEELLLRLRRGVDQNPGADSRETLAFCHELARQVRTAQTTEPDASDRHTQADKRVTQLHTTKKIKRRVATTSQLYRLASFALDLVRKVVRRHEDLKTPANMAGFLPIIGDAIVQGQEEVKLAAVRLLATIIKIPLSELDSNVPVYIQEAVSMVKSATSTTTESAKAALELVTAILRERRSVQIKETDIAALLKSLKSDIDEPDRQNILYRFLRAVLGRKIVITEVYEIMDDVGEVMVVNADRNVRESARSAYLQFIMDYPQAKDRWNKQIGFLVENLKYEHASGRQSVMELLHQLLAKVGDEIFAQIAFTLFVALVPVQVSDQDRSCRQMGVLLVAKLFKRAADAQLKVFTSLMDKWLSNEGKPIIQIAALKCWTSYLNNKDVPVRQRNDLRDRIDAILDRNDDTMSSQLLAAALDVLTTLVQVAPDTAYGGNSSKIWSAVQQRLATQDEQIQEVAATLMGSYLSHLASGNAKAGNDLSSLPLRGDHGSKFDEDDMRSLCRISLRVLLNANNDTSHAIAAPTVRNLTFLGRCFIANKIRWTEEQGADEGEEEDEIDESERKGSDCSAVAFLLNRLSYIIRQDTFPVIARASAIECQSAIVGHMTRYPNVKSIMRPLYTLVDPSIAGPETDEYKSLTDKARALLDTLQKQLGTSEYLAALGEVRNEAKATRDERRRKRKLEAVAAPEKWAADKKRKHEAQRAKKKEKGAEMRSRRRGW